MGDEAEARINEQIGFREPIIRHSAVPDKRMHLQGIWRDGYDAGYKQGVTATRSNLIMQTTEWLIDECGVSADPAWLAHVAVEQFKCGCDLTVDYDGLPEPRTCDKWDKATETEKSELFQNVFGYSATIYKMQIEEKERQARAEADARHKAWKEQCRQAAKDKLTAADIDPELLP